MPRILQLGFILSLLLLFQGVSSANTAHIEKLSGTVERCIAGQKLFEHARIGENINNGDIIRTGADGKAVLRLVDGSTMSFAEESEFMLGNELGGSEKDLIGTFFRGVVRALLTKQPGAYIATPTGIIGIRGTDITLTHSGKMGFYFLDEGGVGIKTNKTTVLLDAGNMTASYAGRKALPPSSFIKSSGLAEARSTLSALTSVEIPSSLKDHALLNEILARWVINYAHYLADSGQLDDAETALLIAEGMTGRHAVEGEILLQIGGLYFYRFKNVDSALRAYQKIVNEYRETPYFENALFGVIRCYHLLKQPDNTKEYIQLYKKLFPSGKHLQELDALM